MRVKPVGVRVTGVGSAGGKGRGFSGRFGTGRRSGVPVAADGADAGGGSPSSARPSATLSTNAMANAAAALKCAREITNLAGVVYLI